MGYTVDELATLFGVAERSVRRWESGANPVPAGIAEQMSELWDDFIAKLDAALSVLEEAEACGQEAIIPVFDSEEDYLQWRASQDEAVISPRSYQHFQAFQRALYLAATLEDLYPRYARINKKSAPAV